MTHPVLVQLDDIKLSLAKEILGCLSTLLSEDSLSQWNTEKIFPLLEKPPELKLGDYAFPCFRFAKELRMKPQDVAQKLSELLASRKNPLISKIDVVGAFLNIFVDKSSMSREVLTRLQDGTFFVAVANARALVKERVMIEFSQPNTHKEFHVGHVRNVVLGDSLCRLYRYCGDDVIAANYPGDSGTHVAKCIWYIKNQKLTPPASNQGAWLGSVYSESSKYLNDLKGDEKIAVQKEIGAVLLSIESGKGETYEFWRKTRQWSLDLFYKIYDFLDVHFDEYFFESELADDSQKIVDEFIAKGVFVHSDGAVGADLNDDKLGFMLVRKSDGNTLYATKDLVLARKKFEQYKVQRSIYVVAAEQSLHFKQVFKTLELMGFKQAKDCYHVSYGLVRLPEGKMSSREGSVVTFRSMRESIEEELALVLKKYEDQWSPEQLESTKKLLCIGAIKYGMLGTDPVKDVIYRAADWVSFEGDTGPYLMYSYARAQSILRKAEESGVKAGGGLSELLTHESEQELIRFIFDFNEAVWSACTQYKPSLLSHHLYDMCRSFSRMYTQVSVLKAESKELLQARINLLQAFSLVLCKGLELLGIVPPEQM